MADKFVIKKLYAFIADEGPGEGVCAFQMPNGNWMPMVGADMKRIDELWNMAQKIADTTEKKITLCEFDNRRVLKEISPENKDG